MIIYYQPDNFSITGISFIKDPNRTDPFIETADSIAESIFLGKEKSLEYQVVLSPKDNGIGFLKRKVNINKSKSINERFYIIPNSTLVTEFKIVQNTKEKTLKITLDNAAGIWWDNSPLYKESIDLAACIRYDLYQPFWTTVISSQDLIKGELVIPYTGTDNFCLFTEKIFESYSHEIA